MKRQEQEKNDREKDNQQTAEKIKRLLGDTIEFSQKTVMMSKHKVEGKHDA